MPASHPSPSACTLLIAVLFAALSLGGCAGGQVDPWEKTNRAIYGFNEGLDRYALKPAADAYVDIVPQPVRNGLTNAFDNLEYGNVILNDFLQGKLDQGWSDAGRMAVNSTVGIAGIFDVATACKMPSHENDFGITLGIWGVKPGPYLVLPLFGPSTLRDVPGIGVKAVTNPTFWIDMPLAASIGLFTTEIIDGRARAEKVLRFRNEAAIDPYVFMRDAYLQYRMNQIRGGQPAPDQSIYDEDTGPTSAPASQPATAPAEK